MQIESSSSWPNGGNSIPKNDKLPIDTSGQTIQGHQTNIAGSVHGPVLSGQFQIQGDFIYNEATKVRLPFQRPPQVPHFTGREAELASLIKDLQPGRVVTICGHGGMGKTALAAEAIWQLAPGSDPPQRFPDGIIFHTFYHKPQAALALEAIARAYGEDPRQSPLDAAKKALAGRRALIVLDGAEACDDLPTVLSVTGGSGVLITTRRHSDAPDDFRDLPPLPEDKAIELLQAWGKEMASDQGICRSICALLGQLPLAIFLAGRYLAHRRQIAGDYLAWLEKTPLEALDLGKRQHQSIPLLMEHSLKQVSDQASACLGLVGVLAMRPFPAEVIAAALQITSLQANNRLGELVDYGLLTRPDLRYQITHALAHTYARERLVVPKDALARLAGHYENFSQEQVNLGLEGYARLDAQRDHILAVQSACDKAGLWNEVRSLTWALKDYLDLQGHWQEWVALVQTGLEAVRSDEAIYDEPLFLTLLGIASSNLGDECKAIDYHEQSLEIFRRIGEKQGEGGALCNLGNCYAFLGESKKAIEYHEHALSIARECGNMNAQEFALGSIGIAYAILGNARNAIEYYEQALIIAREIGNRRSEGNWLGNLGAAYVDLGDFRKSMDYYKLRMIIAREIGDKRGIGVNLGNMGLIYVYLGDIKKGIEYLEQALDIAQEIQDQRHRGAWLGNLGIAYANLGDFKKAIKYYEQDIIIARDIKDRMGEGIVLSNIGEAYADLGEPRKAIHHYDQALAIAREIGDRRGEGNALGNLGWVYVALGETRKAIDHCDQALTIAREIGDRRHEGNWLGNLGLAYADLGETRKAIEHYEQALAIAQEIGDLWGEGNALGNLGVAYKTLGEMNRAIIYTQSALVIFEQIESPRAETVKKLFEEWQDANTHK